MKPIIADKLASVTLNCQLRHDLKVSQEYPCRSGDLVAVRVLNEKGRYNTLELTSGRMSSIKSGDVIVGALGRRDASQGYAGVAPKKLKTGDKLNLLNLGGVLGQCTSFSPTVGEPFDCEVVGQVLSFPVLVSRQGVPANISDGLPPLLEATPAKTPPVVAIVGSNMNSGKTDACLALIQRLVRSGYRVAAGKATGVSLRRDLLGMEDAGAFTTLSFTQLGVVTTSRAEAAGLARTIIGNLSGTNPDVIVLELGDGLLGDYGVDKILEAKDVIAKFTSVVLAAGDPVGAWGGVTLLAKYGLKPTVVTGPSTDNQAGRKAIETNTDVLAINAHTHALEFGDAIANLLERQRA